MAMKHKYFEVKSIRTLTVSHLKGKLVFVHPPKGPDICVNIIKSQIENDKLSTPTTAETASLIYAASQNPDEKYSKEIIKLLKNRYLWCFTGNLYVPNKGVYVQDNPEVKNGRVSMNESDLVKKLESNDNSVRFVPFGYKVGEQSALELERNLFVIAQVGEEGAEKLAEVADKEKSYVSYAWGLDNMNREIVKMTALGSCCGGYSFHAFGLFHGDLRGGYAFGVKDRDGENERIYKYPMNSLEKPF